MKRLISERKEQIYRMRHHEFRGLTCKETAKELGVTMHSVTRHMREMEKKAPQLFPILTRRQADVYHMFVNVGLKQTAIAEILGVTKSCIGVLIHRMRNKGVCMCIGQCSIRVPYMPKAHDHRIRMKF